ncbi:MAG: hypothetical protein K0R93_1438 [Anaerosolibacter sp.]|uniref:hypothetical protein n=1 Tax=Anaerosolibacter sp. TaxID=1872527 RepID=UPI002623B2EB|nr:hypothetical protein [Anaerosolibacter sp.]MDF2546540.1 hypothetical protein [Anaerosolibacter sp.]
MQRSSKHQYIYFHNLNHKSTFYILNNDLFMTMKSDYKNSASIKIAGNILDFAIDADNKGTFHLVSLTTEGDLIYWKNKGQKWYSRILTKYNTQLYQFKNLNIFVLKNNIHILMAINSSINPEVWTLKHHYWNSSVWFNKKVCDITIKKYDDPFYADIDMNNNIHIVYKSLRNNKYDIFYSQYTGIHNIWSTPTKLNNTLQDNCHLHLFCDRHSQVHIVWSSLLNNHFKVFYINNRPNGHKKYWTEPRSISPENINCSHPFIFQVEDTLALVWNEGSKYMKLSKNTNENEWSLPTPVYFNKELKSFPITVIGNNYKSFSFVKIPFTYGHLKDEFFLLAVDSYLEQDQITSKDKDSAFEQLGNTIPLSNAVQLEDVPSYSTEVEIQEVESPIPPISVDNDVLTIPTQDHHKAIEEKIDWKEEQLNTFRDTLNSITVNQDAINQLLSSIQERQADTNHQINQLFYLYEQIYQSILKEQEAGLKKFFNLFK